MPIRRGLSAPQNNFIETIIKRFDGPGRNFVLANAVLEELPIIYCNDGICKLYGYSRATLMQTSSDCKFFKGERTSPEALETIYRFLHEPNEQQIDVVLYKYDGAPVYVRVNVAPIFNEDHNIVMYLINHEEIQTEIKEPTKQPKRSKLNKLAEKYNSSNKLMASFHKPWSRSDSTEGDQQSTNQGKLSDQSPWQSLSRTSSDDQSRDETDADDKASNSNNDPNGNSAEKSPSMDGSEINITHRSHSESTDVGKDGVDSGVTLNIPAPRGADAAGKSISDKIRSKLRRSTSAINDTESVSIQDGKETDSKGDNRNQPKDQIKPKIPQLISLNKPNLPEYKLEEIQIPRFTIIHYSILKAFWDWLILIMVLYTAIVTPFTASFIIAQDVQRTILDRNPETRVNHGVLNPYSDPLFIIDWIVDITFIVDILINFRTTYVNSNDEIITDWKKIGLHYLKSWFIIDLIAAIPFELFIGGEQNEQTITLIGLLKTARLLRVIRVVRKADRYSETGAAILILLMFAFALIAHWLACIWYAIAIAERPSIPNPKYSWLDKLADEIHRPFNVSVSVSGPSITERYLTALYFTFSSLTTVGFGNVSANTSSEKIFAIVVMWFGALLSASIFGNVTAIIQRIYASTARYHSHKKKIKEFVKFHKIPYYLKCRLLEYFQHTWSYHKGIDMSSVLKSFPESLQAEVSLHLNRNLLKESTAFKMCTPSCLRSLAFKIESAHYPPGDYLVMQGDKLNFLYFISRGSVEVLRNDVVVAILGVGDVFGENFYKYRSVIKSNGNVRALTYCDLNIISKESLLEVLDAYPEFAEDFNNTLEITFNLRGKTEPQTEEELATSDEVPVNSTRRPNVAVTLSARNLQHLYPEPTDEPTRQQRSATYSNTTRKESIGHHKEDSVKDPNLLHANVIYRDSSFSKTIDKIISQPKIRSCNNRSEVRPINPVMRKDESIDDDDDNIEDASNRNSGDMAIPIYTPNEVKALKQQFAILNTRLTRLEENISKELRTILAAISDQNKNQHHESDTSC